MENLPDSIDSNQKNIIEQVNGQIEANIQNKENNTNPQNSETKEKETETKEKMNYYSIIKNYLSKNTKNEEYILNIKEKPDKLFRDMTETRLIIWETFLYNFSSPGRKNSETDILCALLEREDQKIIKNDCKRTRVRESILVPGFPKILEAFLTY